jgi:signal recognition particle subunit SRP54
MDGDGRGGAALSMRAATGKPVKLIGVGEKLDGLEDFHPARIADRILGMGDVVGLVEKAAQTVSAEDAAKMARKLKKGVFDLEDLRGQLQQMKKLGGMNSLMGLLPGIGKAKKALEAANVDEKMFDRQIAIINSMTRREREKPDLLNASRRKRIAAGSGTSVQDINKLIKMHRQMEDMMKKVSRGGGNAIASMFGNMGAGMPVDPSKIDETTLAEMQKAAGAQPATPKLPDNVGDLLKKSLPGLGSAQRFPGLPGLGQRKK